MNAWQMIPSSVAGAAWRSECAAVAALVRELDLVDLAVQLEGCETVALAIEALAVLEVVLDALRRAAAAAGATVLAKRAADAFRVTYDAYEACLKNEASTVEGRA